MTKVSNFDNWRQRTNFHRNGADADATIYCKGRALSFRCIESIHFWLMLCTVLYTMYAGGSADYCTVVELPPLSSLVMCVIGRSRSTQGRGVLN